MAKWYGAMSEQLVRDLGVYCTVNQEARLFGCGIWER